MYKKLGSMAIRYGLIPVAHNLIRAYLALIRLQVINEESLINHLQSGRKAIAALWHQRIFGVIGYAGRFSGFAPSAIISASRDGDLIAQLASRLNFRPVRGSSSRGGREALSAMVADLAVHPFAAHASDGPTGPRGVVKAGLIRMAQLSGAEIAPVYISCSRAWVLKSWDGFLIPKPFSRVSVRWDTPIPIPRELNREDFEIFRETLENRLREEQDRDDRAFGWRSLLLQGE